MQDYNFTPFPFIKTANQLFLNKITLLKMAGFLLLPLFILPYMDMVIDFSKPAPWGISPSSFLDFILRSVTEFPLHKEQESFLYAITIALGIFIIILLLAACTQLRITPKKITYRFLGLPIYTLVSAKDVEYSQTIEPIETAQSLFNQAFRAHLLPIRGLLFFPLGKPPYKQLLIHLFSTEQQVEIRKLLKKYYGYREEVSTEHITPPQPKDIHISPKIGITIILCIPIGLLGFYLAAQADFIFVDHYPNLIMWLGTWIVLSWVSFLWIKRDRLPYPLFGAILANFFNATALVFLLFPICHAHYTIAHGTSSIIEAEIIEKTDDRQVWQQKGTGQTFYLHAHLHQLDQDLRTHTMYQVPSKYHWYNHVLEDNAFILVKEKE